jgi:hypothetical protein
MYMYILFEYILSYEMTKFNLISPIGKANQRMGVHGPLNISEVGSGAMGQ